MSKRTREQLIRANQQRIHLKTLTRKANFIAEYVEIKYANVYREALHFFDTLNAAHPVKPDLRKTKEFRDWKTYMKGERPKKRQKRRHNYVKNAPEQYEKQWQQEPGSLSPQSTDQEPKSPWLQASNEEPESPWSQTPQEAETMSSPATDNPGTPQTPQEAETMSSPATDNPGTPQTPQEAETMSSPATDNPGTPQTPQEAETMSSSATDNPGTPQTPQEAERYKDNMILRIPLLQSPQNSPPTVTTETVEIVTEQIEPITIGDIPPQTMEELITELQKDLDIKELFDDLQAQMEFQELGLDIDIDENYLLENELEFW